MRTVLESVPLRCQGITTYALIHIACFTITMEKSTTKKEKVFYLIFSLFYNFVTSKPQNVSLITEKF